MENVTPPSGSLEGTAPPSGVMENIAPYSGLHSSYFAVTITPFSCAALDIAPPLSYMSPFWLSFFRVTGKSGVYPRKHRAKGGVFIYLFVIYTNPVQKKDIRTEINAPCPVFIEMSGEIYSFIFRVYVIYTDQP